MSSEPSRPRYLLKPAELDLPDPVRSAVGLLGVEAEPLDPAAVPGALPEGGGWLLAPPGIADADLGRILLDLAARPDAWCVLVLRPSGEDGALRVVPLSYGYPEDPSGVAERLEAGGLDCGYLSHRHLLQELSSVRHDVNNALTSALAETQFMRMDADEGSELASGLAIVENQLQRIRELAHGLSALRAPRP